MYKNTRGTREGFSKAAETPVICAQTLAGSAVGKAGFPGKSLMKDHDRWQATTGTKQNKKAMPLMWRKYERERARSSEATEAFTATANEGE